MRNRCDTAPRTAVGYVRARRPGPDQIAAAAAQQLRAYGEGAGFAVRRVIIDDGKPDNDITESGFLALMREIRTHAVPTVMVRSPADLSLLPEVRLWMVRMITAAGANLHIADRPLALGIASAARVSGTTSDGVA